MQQWVRMNMRRPGTLPFRVAMPWVPACFCRSCGSGARCTSPVSNPANRLEASGMNRNSNSGKSGVTRQCL